MVSELENKENNLEKKTEYTWKSALFPFSWVRKKYRKSHGESSRKEGLYTGLNAGIYASLVGLLILYVSSSIDRGSLDYRKWSEIQEQKEILMEQEARDYSRERFCEADKNGNLVLDVNEFYDCTRGRGE